MMFLLSTSTAMRTAPLSLAHPDAIRRVAGENDMWMLCDDGQFMVLSDYVCDGVADCPDESDESDCQLPQTDEAGEGFDVSGDELVAFDSFSGDEFGSSLQHDALDFLSEDETGASVNLYINRCTTTRHETWSKCNTPKTNNQCPRGYYEIQRGWHGCCNSFIDCFGHKKLCRQSCGDDWVRSLNQNLGRVCVDGKLRSFMRHTSGKIIYFNDKGRC